MFKNFKSVSMLLFLGGISTGIASAIPVSGVSGMNIVQQGSVCKGVVKDANGETIIGASVVVKVPLTVQLLDLTETLKSLM